MSKVTGTIMHVKLQVINSALKNGVYTVINSNDICNAFSSSVIMGMCMGDWLHSSLNF